MCHKYSYIFMFAPYQKILFIIPPDAHYYKNHRMLQHFKIITLAPTCFGSRRNHHQEAVLCLVKTTIWFFLCSSVYRQSMLWRHINLLCRGAVHSGGSSCLHCCALRKRIRLRSAQHTRHTGHTIPP